MGEQWKTAGGHACAVRHLFAGQAQFMALPGYPPTQVPWPIGHRWCPPPSCPSGWPPSVCERAQRTRRADLIAGRDLPFGQAADTARGPGHTGRQGGQLILGRSGSARLKVVLASASRSRSARHARGNYWPTPWSAVRAAPVLAQNQLLSVHLHHAERTFCCCTCSTTTEGTGE
jgi:hypothetical protein